MEAFFLHYYALLNNKSYILFNCFMQREIVINFDIQNSLIDMVKIINN